MLDREDGAANELELTAQRVLTPAQYAMAYVAGAPSMPDWLALANLLFYDPGLRGGSESGSGVRGGG